jgi:hypothetical protein
LPPLAWFDIVCLPPLAWFDIVCLPRKQTISSHAKGGKQTTCISNHAKGGKQIISNHAKGGNLIAIIHGRITSVLGEEVYLFWYDDGGEKYQLLPRSTVDT